MTLDEPFLLRSIAEIYAAAEQPELWAPFLQNVVDATRSVAGGFHIHDAANGHGSVSVQVGGDPNYIRQYSEYYAAINPWTRQHGQSVAAGDIVVGLAKRDLVGSEYYEDFWAPQGFFDSLSAYLFKEESLAGALIMIRRKGVPEFEAGHVRLLRTLTPHLQRSVRIQRGLARGVAAQGAFEEALDRLGHGVIVVDQRRRVVVMNQAARRVLDHHDGLCLDRLELSATVRQEAMSLRRSIDAAIEAASGRSVGGISAIKISRQRADCRLSVLVSPIGMGGSITYPGPAAFVVVTEDGRRQRFREDVVRDLFGLTRAEARVAIGLAQGLRLRELQQDLGISSNTVRTHLKRVFDKTGTSRQTEVVSLLLRSPAGLAPENPGR